MPERGRARAAVRCVRAGADHRDARGDRPRIRSHGRGRERARRTCCSRSSTPRSRSRAPISWRSYFLPIPSSSSSGSWRPRITTRSIRAEYEHYARNALLQLRRIRHGTQIEEDHMRNRHMIVNWLMAHTSAIEVRQRDGKTYYVMTDPAAFREGVGRLLAEVQRIKARRRLRRRQGAVRGLRRPFRSGAARRGRGARRRAEPAVLQRFRHAAPRGAVRRRRRDRRRGDFVPVRSRDADAGVLGIRAQQEHTQPRRRTGQQGAPFVMRDS